MTLVALAAVLTGITWLMLPPWGGPPNNSGAAPA